MIVSLEYPFNTRVTFAVLVSDFRTSHIRNLHCMRNGRPRASYSAKGRLNGRRKELIENHADRCSRESGDMDEAGLDRGTADRSDAGSAEPRRSNARDHIRDYGSLRTNRGDSHTRGPAVPGKNRRSAFRSF